MGNYDSHNPTHLVSHTMPDESIREVPIVALITNHERWNEGETVNIWHPFPTTADELQAALYEIGADENRRSKVFISGYNTNIGALHEYLPEFANLDELNYLANKLNDMTDEQRKTFGAVILTGRYCEDIADLINIAENLELFYLQPAFSLGEYSEFLATVGHDEFASTFRRMNDSNDRDMRAFVAYVNRLEKHFDATAYARELVRKENGEFTDYGYLSEQEGFKSVYTKYIPPKYRVSTPPERKPQERPSALDKLAAAKQAVARTDAEKLPADKAAAKSPDAEL